MQSKWIRNDSKFRLYGSVEFTKALLESNSKALSESYNRWISGEYMFLHYSECAWHWALALQEVEDSMTG